MSGWIRQRLTYGNVVATLALFIALGGGAYAATRLPANSVGHTNIRKDAVRADGIQKGAVRSIEVRDGALTSRDLAPGALDFVLSAVVSNESGKLVRGRGAKSSREGEAAHYEVVFDRAVSDCAYTATVGDPSPSGEPDAGFAGVGPLPGNSKGVSVVTRDRQGEPNGALDFHLIVAC